MFLNPKIGLNNYNCKRLNVISKQIEAILYRLLQIWGTNEFNLYWTWNIPLKL